MRTLAFVAAFSMAAAHAVAQAPQPGQPTPGQPGPGPRPAQQTPTRDRPPQPQGTAIIRGQVVDAASGQPVRRARVGMFAGPTTVAAQTDADGRFELRNVPAGKFSINATKSGYLSLFASNNNTPIPQLEVNEGAILEGVVLRLSRGGVISGQVLDEFGEPFVGGEVRPLAYRYINGQRQLAPAGSGFRPAFTDDLGAFRLYGLEPGEYYVSVRGERSGPLEAGAPGAEGPAPTYYPGTTDVAEARRVNVRAGRETQGIVFPVALARMARVRGRVITSTGEPFTGGISVTTKDAAGPMQSFGSSTRPDGTFEVSNLPPGTHYLTARQGDFGRGAAESGRVMITVNGDEVNDVMIVTSRGATVRGRIVTDDGSPLSAVAGGFNVNAVPVDPSLPFSGGMSSRVNSDGSFEINGVFDRVYLRSGFMMNPGPFRAEGPNWTVKAVLMDAQDVTDIGLELRPGQVVDNVEIVYTRRVSRLTGRVRTTRGEAGSGWVLVFSSDEARWTPQSRFVRAARADADGQFRLTVTPHDDYLMIALDGVEPGQWQDPDFLRGVKDLAQRFAIGENETKTQDLTLSDWKR